MTQSSHIVGQITYWGSNEYVYDLSELECTFPVTRMIDVRKWRRSFSKSVWCGISTSSLVMSHMAWLREIADDIYKNVFKGGYYAYADNSYSMFLNIRNFIRIMCFYNNIYFRRNVHLWKFTYFFLCKCLKIQKLC